MEAEFKTWDCPKCGFEDISNEIKDCPNCSNKSIEKSDIIEKRNDNSYKVILNILGVVLLIIAIYYLFKANYYMSGDAKIFGGEYDSMREKYVGGDAYNYIIAGCYSTTLTLRALFFALFSSVSFLIGNLKNRSI